MGDLDGVSGSWFQPSLISATVDIYKGKQVRELSLHLHVYSYVSLSLCLLPLKSKRECILSCGVRAKVTKVSLIKANIY